MDPVSLIVGACILMVGLVVGRASHHLKKRSAYVCDCGDPLAMHDPKAGRCAEDGCACRQYVGERPLQELAPEEVLRHIGEQKG